MSNIQPTHTHQQWQNQGRKLCHHANKIYVSLRLTIRLVRQYFTSKTSALSFWCPNVLNGCTKRVCYAWIIESSISARAVVCTKCGLGWYSDVNSCIRVKWKTGSLWTVYCGCCCYGVDTRLSKYSSNSIFTRGGLSRMWADYS